MVIILFSAPILLFILALVIGTGKANFLIAGYNTASKEEKAKTDEKALAKFISRFLFILALIQLVPPIATIMEIKNSSLIISLTSIIFIVVVIIGVIYMNTGNRFERKP